MKKVLIASVVLGLTACGGGSSSSGNPELFTDTQAETVTTVIPVVDTPVVDVNIGTDTLFANGAVEDVIFQRQNDTISVIYSRMVVLDNLAYGFMPDSMDNYPMMFKSNLTTGLFELYEADEQGVYSVTHKSIDGNLVYESDHTGILTVDDSTFEMTHKRSIDINTAITVGDVAKIYTHSTSDYLLYLTFDTGNAITGYTDTGCMFTGTFTIPNADYNMMSIEFEVSECDINGQYGGLAYMSDDGQIYMTATSANHALHYQMH